jgi:DNA-binding IclR family transcriptional regulator
MVPTDVLTAVLNRFCSEWRRAGEQASLERTSLQQELRIPPTAFSQALDGLVAAGFLKYDATSVRIDRSDIAYYGQEEQ